ncbi:MAG: glycosyltransferase family 4 protein [Anaerolineae bacterium]|nr:glycosyltransferase family 4 protein [Anaerolineae bacterium]
MGDWNLTRLALVAPFGLRPKATVTARVLPLARELRALGIDARVFVPPWDDPERSGASIEASGVPVVHSRLGAGAPVLAYRLQREVTAFRPEVVHAFKPIGYSAVVGWASRLARPIGGGVPWVVDGDDWEGHGGWADTDRWGTLTRALISRQERWCYRHADAVTAASDSLRALAWSVGAAPARSVLLPNGLSVPLDRPRPEDVATVAAQHALGDATVLLYTRFAEFPPSWPARMLVALRRRRPDALLLVVGRGLHGEEDSFLREAIALGVSDAVRYVGWLEEDRLAAHLSAAQVAIVPFADTLIARTKSSVKLLELMSLGLPVVASAVGENVPYLDYGRAGVLMPAPLDADLWAAEVNRLLDDRQARSALSDAAAARVRNCYLWKHLAGGALDAYALAAEHYRRRKRQ